MLKNYFKTTIRNLIKNRVTSFINIIGLAVGMAAAILIFEWIQNELSYDQFHANKDNLYKVWNQTASDQKGQIDYWPAMAPPVGPVLKQSFPEVKATTRVDGPTDVLFDYKNKEVITGELKADKAFLTMFSFPLLKGNSEHALDNVNNIVLTEEFAKKVFGDTDPIDKLIKLNNKETYTVTGIMKDLPANTEFQFDCLIPITGFDKFDAASWSDHEFITYVQLQPGTIVDNFNLKIKNLVLEHAPAAEVEIFLQPSANWHLYSHFENGKAAGGQIETVRLMFYIAILILLVACINFMNLGTAQSEKRAKEVGVRKVIGATRSILIKQFLSESIFIAFASGIIAILLVQSFLPAFNQFVDKKLVVQYDNPIFWLAIIGFVLITGLLAGIYPAFFLSAFKPVKVLKGIFKNKSNPINLRKILVVTQFTFAIVLIISTLVIYQQLQYIQHRDNGYIRNNLVETRITGDIGKNYELIKNDLLSSGTAISVCKTGLPITMDNGDENGFQWGNISPDQKGIRFSLFATTGNFVKTMGLKLIAGRDIDLTTYPADSAAILMNETAANITGLKDPVGQTIKNGHENYTIIGIVKDFITGSPDQRAAPMIILGSKYWHNNIAFRLNGNNPVSKNLKVAGEIFKKYNSSYPFEYSFANDEYNQKFEDEIRAGEFAGIFAGLTIFISCLGLFGLAAFMAENRSKEISIRKVLGATTASLVQLFNKEFIALVILAIIIAVPIGWWIMNKWLQDFSYRININWLSFLVAGLSAIIISVLTVSYHSIKAAIANPANNLKSE